MLESEYQARVIKTLKERFPGCVVLKNDSSYQQGFLDLTVLYQDTWAAIEVKRFAKAPLQPNQSFFLQTLDDMSFAAIIYPENEEEVLDALQKAFASRGRPCIPES